MAEEKLRKKIIEPKILEFKDIFNKDPFIIPFSIQGIGAATEIGRASCRERV